MTRDTDHRRADANPASTLEDEVSQFRLLLNGVTDYAIYMLDEEGRIKTWNQGGQRIKGYAPEDIVGTHFSRFYTPEDIADGLPQRGLETARTEGRFAAEGWRVRKDGTRFYASVVIDPIWSDGALIGYAKVTRDITERLETQRLLHDAQVSLLQAQKMEAIGKLTLGLAHDFNNLLAVVINALDLIAMRVSDDPRLTRNVEAALRASERGALLTRQLLTFGRGQKLTPHPNDINHVIGDLKELMTRSCPEHVALCFRFRPICRSSKWTGRNWKPQCSTSWSTAAMPCRPAAPSRSRPACNGSRIPQLPVPLRATWCASASAMTEKAFPLNCSSASSSRSSPPRRSARGAAWASARSSVSPCSPAGTRPCRVRPAKARPSPSCFP